MIGNMIHGWRVNGKDIYFSLALSLAAHVCIALLLIGLSADDREAPGIIAVDLTFMAGEEGAGAGPAGVRKKTKGKGPDQGTGGQAKGGSGLRGLSVSSDAQRPSNATRADHPAEIGIQHFSSASNVPAEAAARGEKSGYDRTEGGGSGLGTGPGGNGAGAGFGPGGAGSGLSGGGGLHGGNDYHYIREMVMKNVRYPEKARRMGQEGRVVLSFIVLENGTTGDIRIINSCGVKLLDESAREGVMNTVIHKKVPYRVMVTLPITYRLQ